MKWFRIPPHERSVRQALLLFDRTDQSQPNGPSPTKTFLANAHAIPAKWAKPNQNFSSQKHFRSDPKMIPKRFTSSFVHHRSTNTGYASNSKWTWCPGPLTPQKITSKMATNHVPSKSRQVTPTLLFPRSLHTTKI
jgi:hypothetical protein